jgi:glycerol-3-phosphate dehydrogenase
MKGGAESSVSRLHQTIDGEQMNAPGLISVLGGKITAYRAIAEEVTDLVCKKLNVNPPCETADLPLPGAQEVTTASVHSSMTSGVIDHLYSLYGSRADEVLRLAESDPELQRALARYSRDIAAQVVFAVREEQCLHLDDFLMRRTLLGFTRDQGSQAVEKAVSHMARELSWSETQISAELEAYEKHKARTQKFRNELPK